MKFSRLQWMRALVALAGGVVIMVGALIHESAVTALGVGLVTWACPWLREIQLDRETRKAVEELDHGQTFQATRRLRRVSAAPPDDLKEGRHGDR